MMRSRSTGDKDEGPSGALSALTVAVRELPRSRRTALPLLLGLMTAAALLDGVSVGAVFSLVAALFDPGDVSGAGVRAQLFELASELRRDGKVPHLAAGVFGIFLAKNAFQLLVLRVQIAFILGGYREAARRVYRGYLRAPWQEHAQRNSAELLRDVVDDGHQLYQGVLLPGLIACSHALAALVVLGVVAVLEWRVVVLTLIAVSSVAAAFYLVIHARGRAAAERRRVAKADMNRWVLEGLSALKEVQVCGKEDAFVTRFTAALDDFSSAEAHHGVTRRAPRPLVETTAVAGVCLLVAVLAREGAMTIDALPVLAALGVALMRLAPAVHGISSELIQIRHHAASARISERLHDAAPPDESQAAAPITFRDGLQLVGVRVRYPGALRDALCDIDLRIAPGEAVAVMGPSGAGKTTLADVVLGLLAPDAGQVMADGRDVHTALSSWRACLGYLPQRVHLLDDDVRHNVAFGIDDEHINDEQVWRALEQAGLSSFLRSLPTGLSTPVGERGARLSGGQQQRVGIARALYRRAALVVLDEATSALDLPTAEDVTTRLLAIAPRPALLVIAHRADTARLCDRVIVLDAGRIVASGRLDDLLREPSIAALLGIDVDEGGRARESERASLT